MASKAWFLCNFIKPLSSFVRNVRLIICMCKLYCAFPVMCFQSLMKNVHFCIVIFYIFFFRNGNVLTFLWWWHNSRVGHTSSGCWVMLLGLALLVLESYPPGHEFFFKVDIKWSKLCARRLFICWLPSHKRLGGCLVNLFMLILKYSLEKSYNSH